MLLKKIIREIMPLLQNPNKARRRTARRVDQDAQGRHVGRRLCKRIVDAARIAVLIKERFGVELSQPSVWHAGPHGRDPPQAFVDTPEVVIDEMWGDRTFQVFNLLVEALGQPREQTRTNPHVHSMTRRRAPIPHVCRVHDRCRSKTARLSIFATVPPSGMQKALVVQFLPYPPPSKSKLE